MLPEQQQQNYSNSYRGISSWSLSCQKSSSCWSSKITATTKKAKPAGAITIKRAASESKQPKQQLLEQQLPEQQLPEQQLPEQQLPEQEQELQKYKNNKRGISS